MAEVSLYNDKTGVHRTAPAGRLAADEAGQEFPKNVHSTDDLAYEQAQWHATKLIFIVMLAILGAEQIVPLSDALRSQIGVLTVLLTFGFWNLLCEAIHPGGGNKQ